MRRDWMYGPHGHGAESWLGPIFMLILLAVLIVGIVFIVRALRSRHPDAAPPGVPSVTQAGGSPTTPNPAALRILEERYARGEIDRDEFYQRRHDLTYPAPSASAPPPTGQTPTMQTTPPAPPEATPPVTDQ